MAIKITVKAADLPQPIPEGVYNAILKDIEEGTGEFGDYLKFSFEISDGEFKGTTRSSLASKKLSKSSNGKTSKLYQYAKALAGSELLVNDSFDVETLKGKSCKIFVNNNKEQDGIMMQRISAVMPS